ncbi:hypothetical protein [Cohnella sp. OV330]|nr:hypothetical protein [Cohnella sp. OV330]
MCTRYLIHRYDKDGCWLQSWGGRGDGEGAIYVAEWGPEGRITKWVPQG